MVWFGVHFYVHTRIRINPEARKRKLSDSDNFFTSYIIQDYYRSGRMLVKLAEAIGRLVLAGREMTRLSGYVVAALFYCYLVGIDKAIVIRVGNYVLFKIASWQPMNNSWRTACRGSSPKSETIVKTMPPRLLRKLACRFAINPFTPKFEKYLTHSLQYGISDFRLTSVNQNHLTL